MKEGSIARVRRDLRVLLVEDDPVDVELLVTLLKREGYSVTYDVVDEPAVYRQQWRTNSYDVVLADHKLPRWTGMAALDLHRRLGSDVPFIVCTGSLGEEAAVDYIKRGASDYVLKFRLDRLSLAIERALREKEYRDERKTLEEQLRQSQKMEAVGRLAGGIAHDFNNLLTVILGRCDLLLDTHSDRNESRRHLQEIQAASRQAASLTHQLLAFSRKQAIQQEVVDLNAIIKNTQGMLERLIPENIQLTTVLGKQLGSVTANPTQMEQILLNLVVNAKDAMPAGGKLTIETRGVSLPDVATTHRLDAEPGPYVVLTVTDTGAGMDAETLGHIFEPFFTTKERGKGTGLGLPTVYGIVKQSGGFIHVESQPNQGTSFRIYLPRTEKSPNAVAGSIPAPERGSGTILVVEDNATVRQLTTEILALQGYRVLSAGNAREAVQTCQEFQGPIDLLLTDVVMPEISGPALAERLTNLRPQLRVLFMSGYTDETISQQGIRDGAVALITKPFTMQELAIRIREILNRGNPMSINVQKRSSHGA